MGPSMEPASMEYGKQLAGRETPIPGLVIYDLPVHGDNRGWFKENWQREKMTAAGLPDFGPVQNNISFNDTVGTTRGIHAEPWDKWVSVATGRIFGAWVDLREGPTFGVVFTAEIDPSRAIFVPRGVGNSYQTLAPDTAYSYLVNDHWSPDASYSFLNLADETAAIAWPIPLDQAEVSAKDLAHPRLADVTPTSVLSLCAVLFAVAFAVVQAVSRTVPVAFVFAAMAAYVPIAVLRQRAARRLRDFAEVWPEAVDNLASAVRAGLSLPDAVAALGTSGPEALRHDFAQFALDYQVTGRFGDCLDRLKDRLADPVGDRVIEGLRLAREVTELPLVAYPNSGEVWDGDTRSWSGDPELPDALFREWAQLATGVGGCCRIGPETITRITRAVAP